MKPTIQHEYGKENKMTSREFCYWLQGFFEISEPSETPTQQCSIGLTDKQARMIKNHLAMVFKHEIDPSLGDDKHQKDLSNLHSGTHDNILLKC